MEITVVGAGVIGLSTARVLADRGHRVRVVADRAGEESTSGVAGAIWFPYLAGPAAKVVAWGGAAYTRLVELHGSEPEAGVHAIVPLYVAWDDDSPPGWAPCIPPAGGLEFVPRGALPGRARALAAAAEPPPAGAWRFLAPLVDPRRHLPWLRRGLDVELLAEPLTTLDALPGERIVLCAGPRSSALVDDSELAPTLGQIAVSSEPSLPRDFAWTDNRNEEDLVYTVPRPDEIILGGCNLAGRANGGMPPWHLPGVPEIRPALTEEIVARCRRAGLDPRGDVRARAGWRPTRSEVRVESLGRVICNYGHGGAGYTLAWGCALDVAERVGVAA